MMTTVILAFLLILLQSEVSFGTSDVFRSRCASSFAGPFKIVVKGVEDCPPEMLGKHTFKLTGGVRHQREFSEPRFSGTFETLEDFDDNTTMEVNIAKWNNVHGWTPNAFHLRFSKVCTLATSTYKRVSEVLEAHEISNQKLCPRSPGNFTLRNVPLTHPVTKFPSAPYGRWRSDSTFSRNNQKVGCLRSFIDTVPRC